RAARTGVSAPGRRLRRELRRVHLREHRAEAEDPAADVARDAGRAEEAGHSGRTDGRAVREAAERGLRVAGRAVVAELSRRLDQPAAVHRGGPRSGSAADAARLRALGDDAELRPL